MATVVGRRDTFHRVICFEDNLAQVRNARSMRMQQVWVIFIGTSPGRKLNDPAVSTCSVKNRSTSTSYTEMELMVSPRRAVRNIRPHKCGDRRVFLGGRVVDLDVVIGLEQVPSSCLEMVLMAIVRLGGGIAKRCRTTDYRLYAASS